MKTNKCLICWAESYNCTFCSECRAKEEKASAIVSQNKIKIVKLLSKEKAISSNNFMKFCTYCYRLIENWKIVLKFKKLREDNNLLNSNIK